MVETLEKYSYKFNTDLTSGFAKKELTKAINMIDKVIVSAVKNNTIGLTYDGYRRLTPKEEIDSILGVYSKQQDNNKRRTYEIAQTSVIKYQLIFRLHGQPIPHRYILIPFATDGGIFKITDIEYKIVPVLTDNIVTIRPNYVFSRFFRDKVFVYASQKIVLKNNSRLITSVLYYENLYKIKVTSPQIGKIIIPLLLYLLAKYGYYETLRVLNISDIIVTQDIFTIMSFKETHDIYKSTGVKPKGLLEVKYVTHDVSIMVNKNIKQDDVYAAESVVSSLLYILDILPRKASDIVTLCSGTIELEKEKNLWMVILSRFIFNDTYSIDKGFSSVVEHFNNLDSYVDSLVLERLHTMFPGVDSFFSLMATIFRDYNTLTNKSKRYDDKSYGAQSYSKYIDVLYYVLYDIIEDIHRTISELNNVGKTKHLLSDKVGYIMAKKMPQNRILSLNSSRSPKLALYPVDSPGDNIYPKITSTMELQENGEGVERSKFNKFREEIRLLQGMYFVTGSMFFLPKDSPTPLNRLNPFMTIDRYNNVLCPDDLVESVDQIDEDLKGRRNIDGMKTSSIELSEEGVDSDADD